MRLRKISSEKPVVLVVDDMPANLTLLRNILEPESYKVLLATSGEKALELLERVTPDLILLDVMMPGIDGFETITQIKQSPKSKDIPVIFITAKTEQEDIVRGFELGAVDYIPKPVQPQETLARTKAHLRIQHLLRVERRQAEQIRAVINNISDSVLVTDKLGHIESANPAAEHLFNYEESQLCQINITELLNFKGNQEDFIGVLLHHHNGHSWWQQPLGKASDGKTFPIDVHVREMFTDNPSFVVVIQDISSYRHEIDQLHHLTETDPLTNIHNRRHFELLLSQSWQHCRRNTQPLSLLFVDVDHFKPFNDHYGHPEGDICLKQVASTLESCLSRAVDSVSRYGGEEFVVILPNTDEKGALKLAEDMRHAIERLAITHEYSEFGSVTVSIGCATYTADKESDINNTKRLLQIADEALYFAKSHGRNRVASR